MNPPTDFSWQNYGAYRAFDRLLERFVQERKSYLTTHTQKIDLEVALEEIQERYVEQFDEGEKSFNEKVVVQFDGASQDAKLVFAHAEYLWAMPSSPLRAKTKRDYVLRWFKEGVVHNGVKYFFNGENGIANPGRWHSDHKYHEINAILRIFARFTQLKGEPSIDELKEEIRSLCYDGIYGNTEPIGGFSVKHYCSVHAAYLHLSAPDDYLPIVSKSDKERILAFFDYLVPKAVSPECPEARLWIVQEKIYQDFGNNQAKDKKYRWFFYSDDLRARWSGENSAGSQKSASINQEITQEEYAHDLSAKEGVRTEYEGARIYRDQKIVNARKKDDNYTCQACGFFFEKLIVHVHHLDPLCERERPSETKKSDLVTLCPNCHYIAHYFLRKSDDFKDREALLNKLKTLMPLRPMSPGK